MEALPGIPPLALKLVSRPTLLAHRHTGYVPRTFRYPFEGTVAPHNEPAARNTFFDTVLEHALPAISQLVILGAGFDTRAFRVASRQGLQCFELDEAATQRVKRRALAQTSVDSSGVTFVSADFEREDLLDNLIRSGFDPQRTSLFVWEGVTMYLTREAIESTLRKIARCAAGSLLAFDHFSDAVIRSKAAYMRYARWGTRLAGEPLLFGLDSTPPLRDRVAEIRSTCSC